MLRVVLIVLAIIGVLLIRMLSVPIAWIILATFLAIALLGPRRRPRPPHAPRARDHDRLLLTVLLVPIALGLIVPRSCAGACNWSSCGNLRDLQDYVEDELHKLTATSG